MSSIKDGNTSLKFLRFPISHISSSLQSLALYIKHHFLLLGRTWGLEIFLELSYAIKVFSERIFEDVSTTSLKDMKMVLFARICVLSRQTTSLTCHSTHRINSRTLRTMSTQCPRWRTNSWKLTTFDPSKTTFCRNVLQRRCFNRNLCGLEKF